MGSDMMNRHEAEAKAWALAQLSAAAAEKAAAHQCPVTLYLAGACALVLAVLWIVL